MEFEYRSRLTEEEQGRDPFQEEGSHFQESGAGCGLDSRGLKDLCFPEGKSGGTWFCDTRRLSRIVKYPWIMSERGTCCVNLCCES